MAIECQSCTAPAELWICPQCITELRADLLSLAIGPEVAGKPTAGLLDALHDVVTKQTATGGSGGHRKRGDDMPDPFEPHTAKSQLADPSKPLSAKSEWTKPTRQGQASDLLHAARNTLTTIVRDLLGKRKISPDKAFQVVSPKDFVGPLLPGWRRVPSDWQPTTAEVARWLAAHAHALACDEAAGRWKRDADGLVRKIEKVIDYPELPRQIGPCPTFDKKGERCNQELRARRDQARINCPKCGVNQDVKNVTRSYLERNRHRLFRLSQIERILDQIDEPVSLRTLQRWHKRGDLKPRGYWRPDGNRGTMRRSDADTPGFWLEDARRIREKSARMQEAGS